MNIEPVREIVSTFPKVLYLAVALIVLLTVLLCCPLN